MVITCLKFVRIVHNKKTQEAHRQSFVAISREVTINYSLSRGLLSLSKSRNGSFHQKQSPKAHISLCLRSSLSQLTHILPAQRHVYFCQQKEKKGSNLFYGLKVDSSKITTYQPPINILSLVGLCVCQWMVNFNGYQILGLKYFTIRTIVSTILPTK